MPNSIQTLTELEVFPFSPNYFKGVGGGTVPNLTATQLTPYGAVDLEEDSDHRQAVFGCLYNLGSKQERSQILDFIHDHKGNRKCFWIYAKTSEFRLKDTITSGVQNITIYNNFYHNVYKTTDRIYMILSDGSIIVRQVQGVVYSTVNNEIVITFTTVLPSYEVNPSDIVEFGRVLCCRFNQSIFEIDQESTEVGTIDLDFIELPEEYPS